MTPRLTLAAACLACLVAAPPALADDYEVDPGHTSIIFGVKHMNISYTYGRFNTIKGGKYTLDPARPEASKFQVAIDVASIDTNNAQRDAHLKNADFFNAGEFPVITFQSTKVAVKKTGDDTVYEVTGDLKMHGVTKSVTLELKKVGEGEGPFGYRSGFICATKLNRSDFGMNKMLEMVGDEIAITISFEGVRGGLPPAK